MSLRVERLFMILHELCVLFLLARTLLSSDAKSNYSDDSNKLTESVVSLLYPKNMQMYSKGYYLWWLLQASKRIHHSKMNHNSGEQNKCKAQSMVTDASEGREMQFWTEKLREFPCGQ